MTEDQQDLIRELCSSIHLDNERKGFWDNQREFGTLLMLVTSELAEGLEADRKNRWFKLLDIKKESFDWVNEPEKSKAKFSRTVKDTAEDEIADAVIRLFDLAGGLGIDLGWHIKNKLEYNRTREARHGKNY